MKFLAFLHLILATLCLSSIAQIPPDAMTRKSSSLLGSPHQDIGADQISIHCTVYTVPVAKVPEGVADSQEAMAAFLSDPKQGAAIISSPSITTLSGVNAQVETVREIIYPTAFDIKDGLIVPGSFETRETGVILNVAPVLHPGPAPRKVSLICLLDITELLGWIYTDNIDNVFKLAGEPHVAEKIGNEILMAELEKKKFEDTLGPKHPEILRMAEEIEELKKMLKQAKANQKKVGRKPGNFPFPLFHSYNFNTFLSLEEGQKVYSAGGNNDKQSHQYFVSLQLEIIPKPEPALAPQDAATAKQLEDILIPDLSFLDANIHDVIDFLSSTSVERIGPEAAIPAPNFILKLGGKEAPKVTISLRRVSLATALDLICEVTGLRYRFQKGAVIVEPPPHEPKVGDLLAAGKTSPQPFDDPFASPFGDPFAAADAAATAAATETDATETDADQKDLALLQNKPPEDYITRFYPVDPNVFEEQANASDPADPFGLDSETDPLGADPFGDPPAAPKASSSSQDVSGFFRSLGLDFPPGTSAVYQPSLGQIVVVNTAENHERFGAIMKKLNKPPVGVEIETRVVEVTEFKGVSSALKRALQRLEELENPTPAEQQELQLIREELRILGKLTTTYKLKAE